MGIPEQAWVGSLCEAVTACLRLSPPCNPCPERNPMSEWSSEWFASILDGSERHPCAWPAGCEHTVEFDDEPFCFTHSPDEGSAVPGYSYKREHPRKEPSDDTSPCGD